MTCFTSGRSSPHGAPRHKDSSRFDPMPDIEQRTLELINPEPSVHISLLTGCRECLCDALFMRKDDVETNSCIVAQQCAKIPRHELRGTESARRDHEGAGQSGAPENR